MFSSREMRERNKQLDKIRKMGEAPKTPAFYCDICKKPFPSATALISHGQKVHGK